MKRIAQAMSGGKLKCLGCTQNRSLFKVEALTSGALPPFLDKRLAVRTTAAYSRKLSMDRG